MGLGTRVVKSEKRRRPPFGGELKERRFRPRRTKMTHKITARLENPRTLIERYPGEAEREIIRIDCELKGDGIKLNVAIRVPQAKRASDDVVNQVASALRRELPSYFKKRRDLFQVQIIEAGGASPDDGDYSVPMEFDIDSEVQASMVEQSEYGLRAAESFETAARRLRAIASQGLGAIQGNWQEVSGLLAYLDRSLEVAELGHMYSWYREKQGGVRKYFHDLHNRKQASHPHVKVAQDYIADNLISYHAPSQWSDRPPTMQ